MTAERLFFIGNFAGMTALWVTVYWPLAVIVVVLAWVWAGRKISCQYRLEER